MCVPLINKDFISTRIIGCNVVGLSTHLKWEFNLPDLYDHILNILSLSESVNIMSSFLIEG